MRCAEDAFGLGLFGFSVERGEEDNGTRAHYWIGWLVDCSLLQEEYDAQTFPHYAKTLPSYVPATVLNCN